MARFNIEDVIRLHNIIAYDKKGAEHFFTCPVCGEKGACSYNPDKNSWHDWKCNAGGGPIELHIALTDDAEKRVLFEGIDGKKAAARDIFRALEDGGSFEHAEIERVKKPVEAKKASDENCSAVYSALLSQCSLKERHYKDLIRRGFTDEQIRRFGFKSVPKDTKGITRLLLKKGYVLDGVPGFFLNKGEWDLNITYDHRLRKRNTGIFCPVFDWERKLLLGFQINVDKPHDWDRLSDEEKSGYIKYVWLSSKDKERGVTSGSISTFLQGRKRPEIVIITEGILKATVIFCLLDERVSVIGIPGVRLFKSALPYLERFGNKAYIFTAYDMDKEPEKDKIYLLSKKEEELESAEKKYLRKLKNLKDADESMRNAFSQYGRGIHELRWDIDSAGIWRGSYKGLDDFLYGYGHVDRFVLYLEEKFRKAGVIS